jgi:hypothetical protein
MPVATIPQIEDALRKLPVDKLAVVYDFVSYLAERETGRLLREKLSDAYQTMLASEEVLRRDWDRPEEDEAWADL